MKKSFKSLIVVLLVFAFSIILTGCNSAKSTSSSNNSNSSNQTTTEPVQKEAASQKMTKKILSLIAAGKAFNTGSYIKGDIPAGEYVFVKFAGSGSYYCEKDAAGNIVDNENFDSFGYVKVLSVGNLQTDGVLININFLSELGVTGGKQLYEILNDQTNYNQGGYYKVGLDIDPGSYVLESIGSSGYYAIMSGPISGGDIVDNDNFSGRSQVNLSAGQYLKLSRAKYTKQ